ncbi:hypothetical protein LTS18_006180 [Coniosporium uncinatum]|uniref:Uncharacterized protein n=1 Tax=Coniosporium uncinatum TaxID=93489 RepID=A0ACC3DD33_9PEZI|nr:hypothetical protein LTS18_006180 [Coniosporium uncinatum]
MAAPPPSKPIDRQTTTPFLLKLHYRTSTFHPLSDFSPSSSSSSSSHPPPPHLQIYTWPTCTLRELTALLHTALPHLLPSPAVGTRVAYRLVFPDTRGAATAAAPMRGGAGGGGGGVDAPGRYLSKELGSVVIGAGGPGINGDDDDVDVDGGVGDTVKLGTGGGPLAHLEGDADKTLQDARFVIGDFVDCAVIPPLANGEVAAAPVTASASLRGGGGAGYAGAGGRSYGGGGGYESGRLNGPPPPRGGGGGGGYGGGYGRMGGRGGGGGRYEDGNGVGGGGPGVPMGEWRRGEVPPGQRAGGGGGGYGRGRGRY